MKKAGEEMKLLQARVPISAWQRLTQIAQERDLSLAQLLRRIIKEWLAKQEQGAVNG